MPRLLRARTLLIALSFAIGMSMVLAPLARADVIDQLIPGTAVLLSQTSGGGGNGGNTSSTSSNTSIFSPAAYVDYKMFGGEPTTVVDHYPFAPGQTVGTVSCPATATAPCPAGDFVYVSAPQGFVYPRYSTFVKSSDLGRSFRPTQHIPAYGVETTNSGGGGDSHIAVGQFSHKVFFVDLTAQCVTMNTSSDLGETFVTDPLGCGLDPSALDDRQWVAVDETSVNTGNVYVSFDNDQNLAAPTLALARSTHDGAPGTFATDSFCNLLTNQLGATINPAPTPVVQAMDTTPTPCPDPTDSELYISGPIVVDQYNTHYLYIPFVRQDPAGNFYMYLAISKDGGTSWFRQQVAAIGPHDPANIFPQLTVDQAGNLYYTWSQTVGVYQNNCQPVVGCQVTANVGGETDVYYTYSGPATIPTSGNRMGIPTVSFVSPIDLTPENNDSAVFPWMVAGSPGQVDLVMYKSNTGLNPNIAFADSNGNVCTQGTNGCYPNGSVWNVYFGQSQNALNPGSNFKAVQISDHPNHIGGICTGGIGCNNSQQSNRDLLDFFTVDVDHLGAANVAWADDNNSQQRTFDKFSRQISGNSILANTNIGLNQSWGITNHAVDDPAGDVYDGAGVGPSACTGMDIKHVSESYSGTILTVSLTLNGPPTRLNATACGPGTGGVWGAEFWASSPGSPGNDNFYVAYVDNSDTNPPHAEAGRVQAVNLTATSSEFQPQTGATVTVGGTCFPTSTATGPCTLTLTTDLSTMGIKSGAGLYSITGLSLYYVGSTITVPFTNLRLGDTEQGDAATPFDDNGTGTTK